MKKKLRLRRCAKQIEQMSAQYTAEKEKHQQERSFQPEDLSEFQTRKSYIDVDLKSHGVEIRRYRCRCTGGISCTGDGRRGGPDGILRTMCCLVRMAFRWR